MQDLFPPLLIVLGVIAAVKAAMATAERQQDLETRAEELERPADSGIQLAGALCGQCDSRIVTELDAIVCTECDKPIHRACEPQHAAGHNQTGPYR